MKKLTSYSSGPIPYPTLLSSDFDTSFTASLTFKFTEYSTLRRLGLLETAMFSYLPTHRYHELLSQLSQEDRRAYQQFKYQVRKSK